MSHARIIQYAVLQWVWRLGREYNEVEPYRDHIKNILGLIAETGEIDFDKLRQDLEAGNF